jgi:DNA-binding transcriptional ArsR family regulator
MSEEQADYLVDNEQPAAIIESPRKVKALQDNGLRDYQVWGWVKMSANFIKHIRILKGAKLSVWSVIALSIDESGFCNLSVPVIASLTDYSQSEVRETIKELDEMGYLSVTRSDGKKNIYDPEFVARSFNSPTSEPLQKNDPSRKTTPPVVTGTNSADPSSPAEENSVPTYKELKELIQEKTKNMKTKKNPDVMAREIGKIVRAEKYLSPKKVEDIVEAYLVEINEEGENEPQPEKRKKKEEDLNAQMKTMARARGVPENEIEFIDRACNAFGFQVMQIDEISLVAYRWIMSQEILGQTIEDFADWARKDEDGKFIGKYRKNGGNIRNDWAQAFGEPEPPRKQFPKLSNGRLVDEPTTTT